MKILIIVRHIQFLTTNWTNFTVNTYASPSSLANISTSAIYWIYVGVVKKFNTFAICNQILGQKCSFSFIGLGVFSNNANYLNLQISVNSRSTILFWICYFSFSNIIFKLCRFIEWPDIINFQNLPKIYSNNILNLLSQLLVSGLWPPITKLLLWEDFSPNATKSSCQIFFHTSWWLKCVF